LLQAGVRHLFLVPGAHIDPLVDAVSGKDKAQGIICSHELGAAFMADGYARMREGIGACAAIGGPGAANLVAAAMTARLHGVPVLYLTGDTATILRHRGAFQHDEPLGRRERKLLGIAVGASRSVTAAKDWPAAWQWAFRRLTSGTPQPVHLSLPYDVQLAALDHTGPMPRLRREPVLDARELRFLRQSLSALAGRVTRIAILAGRELNTAAGARALLETAERFGIPVATTADAIGLFPHAHPLHLGHFGYGGCPRSAALLDPRLQSLLVVGAEWNERNTLGWNEQLERPGLRRLHLRADPGREPVGAPLLSGAPCAAALQSLQQALPRTVMSQLAAARSRRLAWVETLRRVPLASPLPSDLDDCPAIHPAHLVRELRAALPADTTLFCDSGAHRLFATHYWTPGHRLGFMTAARTAPTGWAIAAAIGASFAAPAHPICVLTGDGCMLMHGNELATAARYGCRVLFVVSNNSANGNIHRRLLRLYGNGDMGRLPTVDWMAYARALGVPATRVDSPAALRAALRAFQPADGPCLIEARTPDTHGVPVPAHAFTLCDPAQLRRLYPAYA